MPRGATSQQSAHSEGQEDGKPQEQEEQKKSTQDSQGIQPSQERRSSRRDSKKRESGGTGSEDSPFQGVSLEQCALKGIQLSTNAFVLPHGWVAGSILLQFQEHFIEYMEEEGPLSVGELAEKCGGSSGPVALVMQATSTLGFVKHDSNSRKYSLINGPELNTLKELLSPERGLCGILKRIYKECVPPFDLDSKEALFLFDTWATQRSLWTEANHRGLALLFDGIVLTPLLASVAYLSRWDEEGKETGHESDDTISFRRCPKPAQQTLKHIIKELELGQIGRKWTAEELCDWRRIYDYFLPTAHARLLREFGYILTDNASWGFIDQPDLQDEDDGACVSKPLLSVGMQWLSQPYHRELLAHVHHIFTGHDFDKQPQYIVDCQTTDGSLLALVYDFIKAETPRGAHLAKHPITLIALSDEEESRIKTSVTLMSKNVPNKVVKGNLSDPITAMKTLARAKVDIKQCLHVRAFADHTRTYIPPRKKIPKDSAVAEFAKQSCGETVHLDKYGNQITAVNIFASLCEHLERWATAAQGGAGICMVDVMQMNSQLLQKYFNDSSAFHTEILQSLSRQYTVPPVAFHLAAGMAGLLPQNQKMASTYPRDGKYVRMICQHCVTQNFKIRLAELSDIDKLMELEAHAWAEHLRAPREGLLTRLKTSPTSCFVVTISDEVVAVLYTQRVASLEVIFNEKFQEVWKQHDPNGEIVQLIAINVHPSVGHLGLAQHLRVFALRFAMMEPSIKSVCAVTICREFKNFQGTMEAYMADHVKGTRTDPVVDFHTGFGAKFISLVPGYRVEDKDNEGFGILIHYHIQQVLAPHQSLRRISKQLEGNNIEAEGAAAPKDLAMQRTSTLDLIRPIMEENGIKVDADSMDLSLFSQGMDSLELVQIRNKMAGDLGIDLPSTFLLDYPTLDEVCKRLDEMRGVLQQQRRTSSKAGKKETKGKAVKKEAEDFAATSDSSDAEVVTDKFYLKISVSGLVEYLVACKKEYSTGTAQAKFKDTAQTCYPDMLKYVLAVEPFLMKVQGAILAAQGLLEGDDDRSVQAARSRIAGAISTTWTVQPQVRKLVGELTALAKLDQRW